MRIVIHAPHLMPKPREDRRALAGRPPPAPPKDPTVTELAENFTAAMERWASAGFKTVTREEYDARAAACDACPYWDPNGWFGLGKCKAPGCGCTKFKRWLATEQCAHPEGSRWQMQPSSGNGAG